MGKGKLSDKLTDDARDRLDAVLDQFPGAMNVETMDGFFAAPICAPEMFAIGEASLQVWGEEAEFANRDDASEIATFLMRHWNAITSALSDEEFYWPVLWEDDSGTAQGNDWAQGFSRGMKFSGTGWAELLDDEQHGGWLVAIMVLAHEHHPDPAMRPGPISEERRQQMTVGMVAGLKKIHDYFAPHRRAMAQEMASSFRRKSPKVGRNDPCPCGSGRKYKQCCAGKAPTIH